MKQVYQETIGQRILIIGGTGSLGQTLIRRFLLEGKSNKVLVVSRDESKQWTLRNEYKGKSDLSFEVGDIRDQNRMSQIIKKFRPNNIIMAAALKQVDTCERTPEESIKTNLLGIQSVLDAVDCIQEKDEWLKNVLLVSTDKACEPINVYGMCKAISERLVTSRNDASSYVRHVAVRYGNVLESRGSILPLFKWQAENSDFFTVTHQDMTRFIMTLDESVNLIENALSNMLQGGSIIVPKLDSMRIMDLAEIFSEIHGKPIKFTGIRPGEKMHESMVGVSESIRTDEFENHFIINSPLSPIKNDAKSFEFSSGNHSIILSKEKLRNRLETLGIFKMSSKDFRFGKKIEEIVSVGDKK